MYLEKMHDPDDTYVDEPTSKQKDRWRERSIDRTDHASFTNV